jgi:hypothetical protein
MVADFPSKSFQFESICELENELCYEKDWKRKIRQHCFRFSVLELRLPGAFPIPHTVFMFFTRCFIKCIDNSYI